MFCCFLSLPAGRRHDLLHDRLLRARPDVEKSGKSKQRRCFLSFHDHGQGQGARGAHTHSSRSTCFSRKPGHSRSSDGQGEGERECNNNLSVFLHQFMTIFVFLARAPAPAAAGLSFVRFGGDSNSGWDGMGRARGEISFCCYTFALDRALGSPRGGRWCGVLG